MARVSSTSVHVAVVLVARMLAGGATYAAGQITGKDVKNNSLTGKDVKDGSLRRGDFRAGQLPSGPPGAPGSTGPTGPPGAAGTAGPGARRIDVTVNNGSSTQFDVGPWTLRIECSGDAAHRLMTLGVPGGSGGVQLSATKSISDTADSTIPFTTGAAVPAGQFFGIGVNQPNPGNTS